MPATVAFCTTVRSPVIVQLTLVTLQKRIQCCCFFDVFMPCASCCAMALSQCLPLDSQNWKLRHGNSANELIPSSLLHVDFRKRLRKGATFVSWILPCELCLNAHTSVNLKGWTSKLFPVVSVTKWVYKLKTVSSHQ